MLSRPQQVMFDKIKMKKLTSKQKGDFYYRMSKILKKRLDELEIISYLLNEIPKSYQSNEKIDVMKAAINAMEITEKLVERLDPAYISPIIKDSDGKKCDNRNPPVNGKHSRRVGSRIIRRYLVNVKSYMPGLTKGTATIRVSYEPLKSEIDFLSRLTDHQTILEKIRTESERNSHVYSTKEFNEEILPRLKIRGNNFEARFEFAAGIPRDKISIKESIEESNKDEELALGGLEDHAEAEGTK